MKNFAIITDSCSDLSRELMDRYSIDYVPMHVRYDDREFAASLDWEEISAQDFYDVMRNGTRIFTTQVTAAQYTEKFEKLINEGYDILSISCSSALSASINSSIMAKDEILKKYPDSKIICIDSLTSSGSLALMCIKAAMMRDEGKSIEECAAWIEENKLKFGMEGTPDKLVYLKNAGRVSAASSFFGGLLNIKPIIISDAKGRNAAVEKVKGRKNSLARIVERFKDEYIPTDLPIVISHADCPDEAEVLKSMVLDAIEDKSTPVYTVYIGPCVGASCGPGMIALFGYGKEVTAGLED
jgi:DegV family protein with EDD domain